MEGIPKVLTNLFSRQFITNVVPLDPAVASVGFMFDERATLVSYSIDDLRNNQSLVQFGGGCTVGGNQSLNGVPKSHITDMIIGVTATIRENKDGQGEMNMSFAERF